MAVVDVAKTPITDVARFLRDRGVLYETWPVPEGVAGLQDKASLSPEEQARVVEAYRPRLDRERDERGYVQADMVVLSPETAGLGEMLAKFDRAHYHEDDEMRYVFAGEGVFGFEPAGAEPFSVTVAAGDYIIVPANTYHWFTLTASRSIKALRLFKDASGWTPHYRE